AVRMAMRRALALVTATVLIGGAQPALAVSTPTINAVTSGIELCPQSVCGAAIFPGVLKGQVGSNLNALGLFAVTVTHEPLPDPFQSAAIPGGLLQFQVGLRQSKRGVLWGTPFNNADNAFTARAGLGM